MDHKATQAGWDPSNSIHMAQAWAKPWTAPELGFLTHKRRPAITYIQLVFLKHKRSENNIMPSFLCLFLVRKDTKQISHSSGLTLVLSRMSWIFYHTSKWEPWKTKFLGCSHSHEWASERTAKISLQVVALVWGGKIECNCPSISE